MLGAVVQEFAPDVYVEIDDSFGGRTMVRVLADGVRYIELHDEDAPAWPLLASLQPAEVGNILGWGLYLIDQKSDHYPPWGELVAKMVNSDLDPLTYNRGLLWAFRTENYDFQAVRNVGLAATLKVRMLRDFAHVAQ